MIKNKNIYVPGNKKPYSISKFGSSENCGGRDPDKLLLSRRLQVKSWRWSLISQIVLTDEANNIQDNQLPTYKWIRLGNLDSWGGICPLIELLFKWLLIEKRSTTVNHCRTNFRHYSIKNALTSALFCSRMQMI